ncbi:MAG TPA: hypothetical protein VE912_25255 [Bacteroidales bacterium]|nr:hypothetical protein [Bacteroidales bacterium]
MEIIWSISDNDIRKIEEVINNNQNPYLKVRRERNVDRKNILIDEDSVIRTLLMCLLTSQQRSGPNSLVSQFLRKTPFPVTFNDILQAERVDSFVKDVLVENGLTRYINRISQFFATNIAKFQSDQWTIIQELEKLLKVDSKTAERSVADKLNIELNGIGPKQARNFLTALGLTKYEIPIDSRITNWLNKFGFPVTLSSAPLGDMGYYHFVLNGIQEICKKAEVYPCLLDAAIFSSFDNNAWNEQNSVF